jgi:23S rRNA pseudouridine955/2504/2580 synthase
VLVLGKTPAAAAKLAGAFARRRTQKVYWALVAGLPKPEQGVLELPLVKKGVGDREMVVPADPKEPGAESAETEFVMLSNAGRQVAWMALWPYTGRTHQLRAHMLAMGHPILGDPKYKAEASAALSEGLKLQLHARRLTIPHPSRGTLILEAPISPEMKAGFERFGFDEHEADPEPFRARKGR